MHPKYDKHLKEGAKSSQKMDWFLSNRPVYQVKPEIINNITNIDFTPEFSIQVRMYFYPPRAHYS